MPRKRYWKKARIVKKPCVKICESVENSARVSCPDTIDEGNESFIKLSTISGNFHHGHGQFGANSGRQCVCNSTSAICYGLIRQVNLWRGDDLDTILRAGDRLYTSLKHNLPPGEVYVLLNELPQFIQLFDKTFSLSLGTPISGLVIGNIVSDMESEVIMPLNKAIAKTLSNFNSCFLTFKNSTIAVISKNGIFYIFDSHSRNASGIQTIDGTSVVVKYIQVTEVYDHCLRLAMSLGVGEYDDFEITGVNVRDNNDTDVLQLPIAKNAVTDAMNIGVLQEHVRTEFIEESMDIGAEFQQPVTPEKDYIGIIGTSRTDFTYSPVSVEQRRNVCNMLGIQQEESISSFDQRSTKSLGKPCKTRSIVADGNCFFRALSSALSGTEKHHRKIRLAIVRNLLEKATEFVSFLRTPYSTVDEYIQKTRMKYVGTWATEVEILSAADLFQIDIIIYNGRWLKSSASQLQSGKETSNNAIYLDHVNQCHYEVVCCVQDELGCCILSCDTEEGEKNARTADSKNTVNSTIPRHFLNKVSTSLRARQNIYRDQKRLKRKENNLSDIVYNKWTKEKKRLYMKTKYQEVYGDHKRERSIQKYAEDIVHQTNVKNYSKTKYAKDKVHQSAVKNYNKKKYAKDKVHQTNLKNYSKRKYVEDKVYQSDMKNYSTRKYDEDEVHQANVKDYSKRKYAEDEVHQANVKNYSKRKYAEDEVHQANVKDYSKTKYAEDEVHQANVKDYSKTKYAEDEVHQANVKDYSKTKYAEDEVHQANVKEYSKTKYAEDEVHQANVKDYSKAKYAEDEVHQANVKDYSKTKYAEDEVHRAYVKNYSKTKYAEDEIHQANVKNYSKDQYGKDLAHHQKRKKEYSREKYSTDETHRNKVTLNRKDSYSKDKKYQERQKLGSVLRRQHNRIDRTHMDKVIVHFKRMVLDAPEHICAVCNRRLFRKQVLLCKPDNYHSKAETIKRLAENCISTKYLHECSTQCPRQCGLKNSAYSKLWICFNCHRKILKGKLPAEAVANNLHVCPIPQELACLNSLEQHLIAKHIPFAKVAALPKGGQRGVHGPVVCVPSNIEKTVSCLPRTESEDHLIRVKLKRKLSYKGHYKYQLVSTSKIKKALDYLKEHNDQYKDILFNEDWINPLPVDTNIDMETAEDNNEEDDTLPDLPEADSIENSDYQIDTSHTGDNGMYMDSCLQPVDIGQEILDQQFDKILCVAPAEGNDPIKILMNEENEAKSFPVLFPSGSPTYHDNREGRITIARYLHTRLMLADTRFAKNIEYLFYAQYLSEVYQVISSVSIALRKSHVPSLESKITPDRLLDNDSLRQILKTDSGYKFLKPIRGTPAFWQSAQKDLFAMLRQLGIPTWFCSFSAGDTRWPEVLDALLKENSCQQNVNDLDWSDKSELLRSNPVTAARMFEHRFQCFLKEVILSAANPVGKVKDYFYRVEFQHRGSPHVHCLLWVEDAPQLDKDSDEDVAIFIDKYVTCEIPNSEEEELNEIVTTVQKHSRFHSKSCRKKGTKCRFNFPRPPSNETYISRPHNTEYDKEEITDPTSVRYSKQMEKEITKEQARQILQKIWKALDDSDQTFESIDDLYAEVGIDQELFRLAFDKLSQRASVVLQRGTDDVFINQYNKDLLLAWNANMDIQFVLDAYSCIVYIISYISKSEREMGLLLEQTRKETLNGNEDAKQAMKKLGVVFLHSRELSAQEAVYRVCNLHLKECSRFVQFIPVGDAIKMSLPLNVLKNKSKGEALDTEDMWMTSIVDRYKNRPMLREFVEMCLATFCSQFRVLPKSEEPSKESNSCNVYQLQNGLGFIKRRTRSKPAVIRFPRFSSEKQPEKYYQSILQLYLPHRSDSQLKPESFESHEDFYQSGAVRIGESVLEMVSEIVLRNQLFFEKNADEIERAQDILEKSEGMEDAWAQICPESEQERISCEEKAVEKHPDPDSNDDIPDLIEKEKRDHTIGISQSKVSHEEAKGLLRSLNTRQQLVFYQIRQWCLAKKNNEDPDPFFVFITGGAGTGKSHLIKSIYYEANRLLLQTLTNIDDISVLLTAPTGVAAFNINAGTIHSTFSISIESKLPYQPLGDEKLNTLRAKLENLQILIIDEISMVDHKLLAYIHGRLRQIKQCKDYSPFAHVSIIAVGDFYQLPPVKGKPLYSEEAGIDLWNDNFKLVELTAVMRQKNKSFVDTLNRLRTRKKSEQISPDDAHLLNVRETGEDSDAIHIFPTNAQVDLHNLGKLKTVCTDIVTIDAEDFEKDPKSGKLRKRESQFIKALNTNLARHVSVGIGARVLLTKNIDVSDGLVNGVFGTVSHIPPVKECETYPSLIYVVFDNVKVGTKLRKQMDILATIPNNSTPIRRAEDRVNTCGGLRRQFPLKLSFACTVHKVQGITLDKAVVSLDRVFAPGQAYVALSRVTSIEGLTIQDFKEAAIYCNEKVAGALSSMTLFLSGLDDVPKPQNKATCKVILHNIQSLNSHIEDIKNDQRFTTADIICVTETWLTCHQGQDLLEGFTLHHKTRSQCYDKNLLNLRNQLHGGVGIFCKEDLHVRDLDLDIKNIECVVVHCLEPNVIITVMYRPPSYKLPVFRQTIETLIQQLDRLREPCIILGDFNEDALNNSTISMLLEQHGFQQCVKHATTENGTLIDHVYSRDVHINEVQVIPTYFSYHEAISLIL